MQEEAAGCALAVAVVGVLIALIQLLFGGPLLTKPTSPESAPTSPKSGPVSTAAPPTSSPPGSPTPTPPPGPTVTSPAPQDLGEILSQKGCGNPVFSWGYRRPASIAGVDYPTSLPVSCSINAGVASADFLVPTGAKFLTGTIGIDDHTENADAKVTFSVFDIARRPLVESKTLAYGEASQLLVPVSGVARVRLQVQFSTTHSYVSARWANMQFTF
jgi:hypothetical protein